MDGEILEAAATGHNILITGQAGTGKSCLLREIHKTLSSQKKLCQLTATTGIASVALDGMTIHKFSGIMDGRYPVATVLARLTAEQLQRINSTDTMIIDEISMMSHFMFTKIDKVLRHVRGKINLPFGGIQTILCGDFLQLQPVPNTTYGDAGDSLMRHQSLLSGLVPHHFVLKKVHRQNEDDLIQLVDQLSKGEVNSYTWKVLRTFSANPPDDAVQLFANNLEVHIANQESLLKLEGQEYRYKSVDHNPTKLTDIPIPAILILKVGSPVILRRSLSNRLVNGLQGMVTMLTESYPVVTFENGMTVTMQRSMFYTYRGPKVKASREQFPITLAYALTVHKAQGLTLRKHVIVDATSMNQPGQLAVAVGRARSKKQITVINLDKCSVASHPPELLHQYEGIAVDRKNRCCHLLHNSQAPSSQGSGHSRLSQVQLSEAPSSQGSGHSRLSQVQLSEGSGHSRLSQVQLSEAPYSQGSGHSRLSQVQLPEAPSSQGSGHSRLSQFQLSEAPSSQGSGHSRLSQVQLPEDDIDSDYNLVSSDDDNDSDDDFVTAAYFIDDCNITADDVYSEFQVEEEAPLLQRLKNISAGKLYGFLFTIKDKLCNLASKNVRIDKKSGFNAFFAASHAYSISDMYEGAIKVLDRNYDYKTRLIGMKIFQTVREKVITTLLSKTLEPNQRLVRNSAVGEENIGHIAGWVVHKMIRKIRCQYDKTVSLTLLSHLKSFRSLIDQTSSNVYTDSVELVPGSMVRVTYSVKRFFISLDSAIRKYETPEILSMYKCDIYNSLILPSLEKDSRISTEFTTLAIPKEYKDLIFKLYVKMSAGQFRRALQNKITNEVETRKAVALVGKRKRAENKAPCVVCDRHCAIRSVMCDKCGKWCHYRCGGLTGKEGWLKDASSQWLCPKCQ